MATPPGTPAGSAALARSALRAEPETPPGSAAGRDVWARGIVLWDLAFFVAVAAGIALVLGADELDTAARTRAALTLVALAGWYAAFGARALHGRSTRLALVYLAGMIPLFLVAVAQYETLGFLLFVLYAQPWTLLDRLSLILATDATLAVGVGVVAYVLHRDSWLAALAQSGISLGFAVLFGFWMYSIIGQSIDRRTVIDELERTRQELAAVSHRAGVLAERERLAREIHDTIAQGFTSVVVLLELAESEVDTDPVAARQRLATARETARQNLAEARALVAALTPVDLQAAPLPEAIGRLVDRFGAETGVPIRLTVTGETPGLPANAEVVLLRAAQEALANVRKHAGASRVEVSLDGAALTVTDDGAGFDPAAPTAGYGLAGMRRRVEEVGGTLVIHSGRSGTRVEVRC
jgi:signal transduction histidine kinase